MRQDPAIAHVYAEGLIAAAQREGKVDAMFDQAEQLLPFIQKGQALRTFLESPRIRREEKHARINAIFQERIEPLLLNLIHLMLRNNRIENLGDALRLVYELVEQLRGIVPAIVTTAVALDDDQRAAMKSTMEDRLGSRFDVRYRVDADILGGAIFKYRDRLIDGSLRFDLKKLFTRMMAVPIDNVEGATEAP
jgi:F-type H+-transporting ATPase subunit delta